MIVFCSICWMQEKALFNNRAVVFVWISLTCNSQNVNYSYFLHESTGDIAKHISFHSQTSSFLCGASLHRRCKGGGPTIIFLSFVLFALSIWRLFLPASFFFHHFLSYLINHNIKNHGVCDTDHVFKSEETLWVYPWWAFCGVWNDTAVFSTIHHSFWNCSVLSHFTTYDLISCSTPWNVFFVVPQLFNIKCMVHRRNSQT